MQLTQETLERIGTGERSLPSRIGISHIKPATRFNSVLRKLNAVE
jgi:hypothetical protein